MRNRSRITNSEHMTPESPSLSLLHLEGTTLSLAVKILPFEAQPNASSAGKCPSAPEPTPTLPPLPHRAVTVCLVHTQPQIQMPPAGFPRICLFHPVTERNVGTWNVAYVSASTGPSSEGRFYVPTAVSLPHHSTHHLALLSPPSSQRLGAPGGWVGVDFILRPPSATQQGALNVG